MSKNQKYLIALAGLFHDIGKLLYRAEVSYTDKSDKDIYSRYHAFLSKKWIEQFQNIFNSIEPDLSGKLINWGARHHNPTNEMESIIIQIADRYSSAHDREKVLKDELNLLHSVFERITLKEKYSYWDYKNFGLHFPSKLELNKENIFPATAKGYITEDLIIKYGENEKIKVTVKNNGRVKEKEFDLNKKSVIHEYLSDVYKNLYTQFENEFNNFAPKFNNSLEQFVNFSFYILQKYLWAVPASTYDQDNYSNHYPDISLFDHSRILSAIATSLYDYAIEKNIKPKENSTESFDNEDAFLLIEGDVGGIQKFLFNIYKSSEASEAEFSIAKALRGRSFFLSMLPEIFARYILEKLRYPITNALYIGGGKFQLLVGNTKENIDKLKNIEDEINKFLFEEFNLELSFVLAYVKFKGNAFKVKNGFLNQIELLQVELDRKKKQRAGNFIFKDLETLENASKDLCPSCRSMPVNENNSLCKWCDLSQTLGNDLPKNKYIGFSINAPNLKANIDISPFGKIYLLDDDNLKDIDNNSFTEILALNTTEFKNTVNGFKFLGNTVPIINKNNKEIFKSITEENIGIFIKEDNVLPFEVLVKFAQGDKKLGFFRADVDNLGLILSDGLRTPEVINKEDDENIESEIKLETEEESIYTISRIATLSRMLDLYFSGYLNTLASDITNEYLKELMKTYEDNTIYKKETDRGRDPLDSDLKEILKKINDKNLNINEFINSLIYIVYSGGDDLFIIAPYNLALRFAQKIREEFKDFIAENKEFGLSGGLLIAHHNLPINLVAKYTESLEDEAKKGSKDKLAIFSKAYKWKDFGIGESSLNQCDIENNKQDNKTVYFDEIEKFANNLKEFYNKETISRGFLYNLLTLYKAHTEIENDEIIVNPIIYPKLHYQIARNIKGIKDEDNSNVKEKLISPLLNTDEKWIIENLDTIVSLVLMKTRKGG